MTQTQNAIDSIKKLQIYLYYKKNSAIITVFAVSLGECSHLPPAPAQVIYF